MNILVIGGTRFIGAHTVKHLVNAGHTVTVFHRGKSNSDLIPGTVEHIHGERDRLTDFREQFRSLKPDVILDTCLFNEHHAQIFVDTMRGIGSRVILLSSGDVYRAYGILNGTESGPNQAVPISEDDELRTVLYPYRGETLRADDDPQKSQDFYDKIPVERMLAEPFDTTILRLPAVYGPGDHRPWPYLKRMIDQRPIIILGSEVAGWRFQRGYITDVADAISIATTDERALGRIYNVGDAESITEREWVEAIADVYGWDGEIRILPQQQMPEYLRDRPATPSQHLVYDTSRIREELGWESPTSIQEGLRQQTIAWEVANPPDPDASGNDYDAEDRALAEAG